MIERLSWQAARRICGSGEDAGCPHLDGKTPCTLTALEVYSNSPRLAFTRAGGSPGESDLLDFELEIVESRRGCLGFAVKSPDVEWRGQFSLGGADLFQAASPNEPYLVVQYGSEEV